MRFSHPLHGALVTVVVVSGWDHNYIVLAQAKVFGGLDGSQQIAHAADAKDTGNVTRIVRFDAGTASFYKRLCTRRDSHAATVRGRPYWPSAISP